MKGVTQMDQQRMFKQMIDFQKKTFDNSFAAMTTLQEQGEKMMNAFLDQAPWLPNDGKKVINDWLKTYKTGRENFKNMVETNFSKVDEYFEGMEKTESKGGA
jgi:hypothetical protein